MTLQQGGALIFAMGALLCLVVGLMMLYEAYALLTGNVLITQVTRGYIDHHRIIAIAFTGAVLILIGHFWV